jgi:hypothetical protein
MGTLGRVLRYLDAKAEELLFDRPSSCCVRRGLLALLLAVAAAAALSQRAPVLPPNGVECPENVLVDKIWIDRVPETGRDSFSLYFFSSEEAGEDDWMLGVHVSGTLIRRVTELFAYRVRDKQLKFVFPADGSSASSRYSIVEERKGQFELKLSLASDPRHGGEAHVYRGRHDGKVEGWPARLRAPSIGVLRDAILAR